MQREFARSAACILNTSIARIGSSTGRSTTGGHQKAEETCKWTNSGPPQLCGFPCLRPSRVSLVMKNKLLWVICTALGTSKVCRKSYIPLKRSFPVQGAASFSKSSRDHLRMGPFLHALVVAPNDSKSWEFLSCSPTVFLTWEFF